MTDKSERIDWADEKWKHHLIGPRKFMLRKDTRTLIAQWLDITPGMTIVDVGCGLGYLGYTYWEFFGEGGKYYGVDESEELIEEAAELSGNWAVGGEAHFKSGDAYSLPFEDDFADIAICQALLMHLDDPVEVLKEMKRVARPGGQVVSIEPDNLSASLHKPYTSIPELTMEEELFRNKITLICYKGRLKLGKGDYNIGVKIPHIMKELGLDDIDIRLNDQVCFVEPPYESEMETEYIGNRKKHFITEQFEFELEETKKEFIAGGGDPQEFEEFRKLAIRRRDVIKQQLDDGNFSICHSNQLFYIRGTKPA
ncbi:MAG: methyltransferase domain-containing protein [candidate division Zixibacteria bacterium]|nr:methyltransferase domain-containing protein [candidate division Zixibacteria bacterium]